MPKKTKKMKANKNKKPKRSKRVIEGYYIPGDGTIKTLYKRVD
jgi:hypothetical protein